ncbi:WXG100 family type VII secretion target [Jatrophihabitans endophyticus]|uniref:WXG100 family type VII secretion target n=1 Tax=Jatrophihabitans endophyticus TaxID=1206085 RepID=UPI0019FF5902|nr:WXG100 family type VII secretion target [Jatrophihabitans endophyticus]MBE7189098.1 WXG100 family type VII secretion target [Jatrophihabitans endophyticus]
MSGFDTEPIELFAAGARVSEAAVDGHAALTRVRLDADDLLDAGWTGAAAAAFRGGVDQWLSASRSMLAGLEDLSSALTAAGHDYETAESGTLASLARLAS